MAIKQKKTQVTLILAIAIVIIIIFSIFYFLSRGTAIKKFKLEVAEKTLKDTKPVKEFIQQCMNQVIEDALVLIGKQGGQIFRSQDGNIDDFFKKEPHSVLFNNDYVRTAILLSQNSQRIISSSVEYTHYAKPYEYPWVKFPYKENEPSPTTKQFLGIFGDSNYNLPPLEGMNEGIKEQLEAYVINNAKERCSNKVDSTKFALFEKEGFNVKVGDIGANVVITDEHVDVFLEMPVEIIDTATNTITKLKDFSSKANIRFKKIYATAKTIFEQDISRIDYDIENVWNLPGEFAVSAIAHNGIKGRYSIVVIEDSKSVVNNKPYKFQFARKNRAPALHYLRDCIGLSEISGEEITNNDIIPPNTLCSELSGLDCLTGMGIEQPKAWDPDEDKLEIDDFQILELNTRRPLPISKGPAKIIVEVTDKEEKDWEVIEVKDEC